jgi:hypothetical protein
MSTADNKAFQLFNQIKKGQVNTEQGYAPILAVILPMALMYFIAVNTGLNVIGDCEADIDESIKKYLNYSLIIAVTIPGTLLFSKMVEKDVAGYMTLYGVAAIAATGILVDVMNNKCPNADETQKNYNNIYLAIFSMLFCIGTLMLVFVK